MFDTPCTQSLWEAVTGDNPSQSKSLQGSESPRRKSQLERLWRVPPQTEYHGWAGVGLPIETQWEYARRAGTEAETYAAGFDPEDVATQSELKQIACYDENAGGTTHEVAQLQPNPWGLYDMFPPTRGTGSGRSCFHRKS